VVKEKKWSRWRKSWSWKMWISLKRNTYLDLGSMREKVTVRLEAWKAKGHLN